jgi:probable rRNA maturation factor
MADGDSRGRPSGRPSLAVDIVRPPGVRAPGLGRWLQLVAPGRARGTVTIAIVPDGRVRALNRLYRKKDRNTDVLSFPVEGPAKAGPYASEVRAAGPAKAGPYGRKAGPGFGGAFLGDIVIAAGVARRQARDAGHSLQTELRILALHGLLHLLGYDHERDDGRMARLERRLRRKGGLREGLIERAAP